MIHAPESEDQAINRDTIIVWATDSSGEDSTLLRAPPYGKLLTSYQVTVSSMDKKTEQPTKFSRIIAVSCLVAILTPIIILFAIDIPESLRDDWQPWAMGLYAVGILRLLSVSTKL